MYLDVFTFQDVQYKMLQVTKSYLKEWDLYRGIRRNPIFQVSGNNRHYPAHVDKAKRMQLMHQARKSVY